MSVFRVTCVSGSAPGLIDSWSNPVLHHYFPSKQHVDQQHLLRSVRWSRVLSLMHWWCFLKPRSRAWSWGFPPVCAAHMLGHVWDRLHETLRETQSWQLYLTLPGRQTSTAGEALCAAAISTYLINNSRESRPMQVFMGGHIYISNDVHY